MDKFYYFWLQQAKDLVSDSVSGRRALVRQRYEVARADYDHIQRDQKNFHHIVDMSAIGLPYKYGLVYLHRSYLDVQVIEMVYMTQVLC